jgi:hypothetical protein
MFAAGLFAFQAFIGPAANPTVDHHIGHEGG